MINEVIERPERERERERVCVCLLSPASDGTVPAAVVLLVLLDEPFDSASPSPLPDDASEPPCHS